MHTEILSKRQKEILPALTQVVSETDLYLAGGTALALHIGHRPSIDFVWFASTIGNTDDLIRRLTETGLPVSVLSISHETVYVSPNEVQISFIGYAYPLLRPTLLWPDHRFRLAHLEDIAAMKLSAITNRGSRKDFIDLFFLIREHFTLAECLTLFSRKFRQRDIGHVLRSLVYFEDADAEPDVCTKAPLAWSSVKKDLESKVKGLTW